MVRVFIKRAKTHMSDSIAPRDHNLRRRVKGKHPTQMQQNKQQLQVKPLNASGCRFSNGVGSDVTLKRVYVSIDKKY